MKKWLVGVAGVFLSLTLAACGSSAVATTNGGKITQSQYYSSMKETSNGKQILQQMILNKVLEKNYGSKVKDSQVNKLFNQYKSQYGSQFSAVLQQQGLTNSTFKSQIRDNLLLEQAVRENTNFSDAALKKQFKSYQPKITVNAILVSKKATAETVISQLKSGKSFSSLAKKYSTDTSTKNKGGRLPAFDNTSSSVDSAFKKAAYKLEKKGDYTMTPVKTQYGYQIIQMVNHPAKGNYKDHTSELKDQIVTSEMSDSTTLHNIVAKVLRKGDVDIKDNQLKDILASYITTESSTSSK
ncbi:peptidylprolyl isomerase PrsA [Lactobacillus sp. Sy-1]|uniref:peptidylprolyl isomerase PrsA n=1 Tax=Lactobacillus sp. Sy-1 TaxID=2109645 RepID=UPI001C578376|nr:peptidylprolyl isomerase PrsA [Lactobacillus sp. Sy-1]MBW1605716.1 peptidylprolyl isomerase [Lactobacillus sp. Sy-1]